MREGEVEREREKLIFPLLLPFSLPSSDAAGVLLLFPFSLTLAHYSDPIVGDSLATQRASQQKRQQHIETASERMLDAQSATTRESQGDSQLLPPSPSSVDQ